VDMLYLASCGFHIPRDLAKLVLLSPPGILTGIENSETAVTNMILLPFVAVSNPNPIPHITVTYSPSRHMSVQAQLLLAISLCSPGRILPSAFLCPSNPDSSGGILLSPIQTHAKIQPCEHPTQWFIAPISSPVGQLPLLLHQEVVVGEQPACVFRQQGQGYEALCQQAQGEPGGPYRQQQGQQGGGGGAPHPQAEQHAPQRQGGHHKDSLQRCPALSHVYS